MMTSQIDPLSQASAFNDQISPVINESHTSNLQPQESVYPVKMEINEYYNGDYSCMVEHIKLEELPIIEEDPTLKEEMLINEPKLFDNCNGECGLKKNNIIRRKQFTMSKKIEILNQVETGVKKAQICKNFKIAASTLSTLIKNQQRIREAFQENSKRKKLRTSGRKDLDIALLDWCKSQPGVNVTVSGQTLQEKARQLGVALGYGEEFQCSTSWISRFKERHQIGCKKNSGETIESTTKKDLDSVWATVKSKYKDCDIFNADEVGLFCKLTPGRAMQLKQAKYAEAKDRVTLLVCANADGSEKRKLLVIGRRSVRCFRRVKSLPVKYFLDRNAWMTSEIFVNEIREWDNELCRKSRKILLIVDNCAAHPNIDNLKNIKVMYLLPETTSTLQPLEQGIIRSLKFQFRKLLVMRLIEDYENNKQSKITLLDSIRFLDRAWNNVSAMTIRNGFRLAGFIRANDATDSSSPKVDLPLRSQLFLRFMGNINFEDYVAADDHLATTGGVISHRVSDDINNPGPSNVRQITDSELSDEEVIPKISAREARRCIRNVRYFFESKLLQDDDDSFRLVNQLEDKIDGLILKEGRQCKITDYFMKK